MVKTPAEESCMKIQIENVIWQFAKFYREKYIAKPSRYDMS
jgi:hypothetical protein